MLIEVWGAFALFTRPEFHTERYTYDVPTPSSIIGILQAIYYHPCMRWVVNKIYVLNPIEHFSLRRNEVKDVLSFANAKSVMNGNQNIDLRINADERGDMRSTVGLRDVHYVIDCSFVMTDKANPTDSEAKVCGIIQKRLRNGKCFHQPYFGVKEFPAYFQLWEGGDIVTAYPDTDQDLGIMLYGMDHTDPQNIIPIFFKAYLEKGVLDLSKCEVIR